VKRDDWEFRERIALDIETRKIAAEVLDVADDADKQELKKAYRKAAVKYHPDHNRQAPDANKKFALVKCAYQLLTEDKPCPELLKEIDSWRGVPEDDKYSLDNAWGHFLWWREKFF